MENTYLLLHPSSARYVKLIFDEIHNSDFEVDGVYRIDDWEETVENVYASSYKKSSTVKQHVKSQAYINMALFGEHGLLVLLRKEESYDELVKSTLNLKFKIRDFLYAKTNELITIYIDLNKSIYKGQNSKEANMDKIFLSFIHCPDSINQYKQDLQFFCQKMRGKKLSDLEIDRMIRYQTFLI
ncbi:MAG: hypothetical protein K6G88_11975 [Lachnospiraceae bacterium]|nr:hypothetical protein [Lachnospiraceae bacterium]